MRRIVDPRAAAGALATPVELLRKDPERLLTEALTRWSLVHAGDGMYLHPDSRREDPVAGEQDQIVPGAQWLAQMALPVLGPPAPVWVPPIAADVTMVAGMRYTPWARTIGSWSWCWTWPVWGRPLDTYAVAALLTSEHLVTYLPGGSIVIDADTAHGLGVTAYYAAGRRKPPHGKTAGAFGFGVPLPLMTGADMLAAEIPRYLSRREFADRIGVHPDSLGRYRLPEPDATIGTMRGWLPETVDRWQASRPGRGARTDLAPE